MFDPEKMSPVENRSTIVCKNAHDLADKAAEQIIQAAREAIERRGRFTVALPGGSTPEKTYERLAQPTCSSRVNWEQTYLFLSDERFVPADDPRSNFALVRRTLLTSVLVPDDHVFPVATHLESAERAAVAYQSVLETVFGPSDRGRPPRFDLILLGLGEDGHTASVFPHAAA
jgi:6-phosphogluconolactonase